MLLFFIRHAQSEGNLETDVVHTQKDDSGLTDKGKRQAREIAAEIEKTSFEFASVITSPLPRAVKTSTIIADQLNLPLEKEDRLLDISRGVIDGLSYKEINKKFPNLFKNWGKTDPGEFAPPKGESFSDVMQRVRSLLDKLDKNHILVSHQDTIIAAGFSLLKIPIQYFHPAKSILHVDNATITPAYINFEKIFIPFVNKKHELNNKLKQADKERKAMKQIIQMDRSYSVGIGSFSYNNNYLVKNDKGKQLFVKFFAPKYLPKIKRELRIIKELQGNDFSVTAGKIKTINSQCCFLKTFKGRYSLFHWWRFGLSKKEKKRLLKRAAKDLAKLHGLKKPIKKFWQFPQDKVEEFSDWLDWLKEKMKGDLQVIQNSNRLPDNRFKELSGLVNKKFKHYTKHQTDEVVRLHGDFHLDNILLDKEDFDLEYIDFENARVGDRLWDLANFYKLCFLVRDNEAWKQFFSNYYTYAQNYLPEIIETKEILRFLILLNFTGSLKQKIENSKEEVLKAEMESLVKFMSEQCYSYEYSNEKRI